MIDSNFFEGLNFPPLEAANSYGLLGYSLDIFPRQVLAALKKGIFPWYAKDFFPYLWWAPDPRFVVFPEKAKISKSLKKSYSKFSFDINKNFEKVIFYCANVPRKGQTVGTWIDDKIIYNYTTLHQMGYAMSFETYYENKLVGGLYGVNLGGIFSGESLFHLQTDASKSAFLYLVNYCLSNNIYLIDCQTHSPLLESLGGEFISRKEYSDFLQKYVVNLPKRKL